MSSAVTTNGSSSTPSRRCSGRLPRWTRQEIITLVEAKQAYEKQCSSSSGLGRPGQPKWTFVSAYCGRHGVERGPLQCRKRWSNLACDFKKIKAWEGKVGKSKERELMSYWTMRSDMRRERKLAGFFDREVFETMDVEEKVEEEEEEEVFDSGRTAKEDGLFSESEEEEEEEEEEETFAGEPIVVVPISERKFQPENENSDPGNSNDKPQTDQNAEKGSSSWEGQKRQRTSSEAAEETSIEDKLIKVLEKNSRILSAQLEAQNFNCQLDRDQRKDQADGLLNIMTKLADALGRIADKL